MKRKETKKTTAKRRASAKKSNRREVPPKAEPAVAEAVVPTDEAAPAAEETQPPPDLAAEVITEEIESGGPIEVPEIGYPNLCLWDVSARKLQVVNGDDLPITRTLDALGIDDYQFRDSFGIADGDEIGRRLEMMKFLMQNASFTDWLADRKLPQTVIPDEPGYFLDFFCGRAAHNPYWEAVHELTTGLKAATDLPARLRILIGGLEKSAVLEDTENDMGQIIAAVLESATVIEGTVAFRVKGKHASDLEVEKYEVFGHQRFSADVRQPLFSVPPWARDKAENVVPRLIKHWVQRRVKKLNQRPNLEALRATVISQPSPALLDDIQIGLYNRLDDAFDYWPTINNQEQHRRFGTDDLKGSLLHVYFVYDSHELRIRIYDVEPDESKQEKSCLLFDSYDGYPEEVRATIARIQAKVASSCANARRSVRLHTIMEMLEKAGLPVQECQAISSIETDKRYKLFAVANMLATEEIRPALVALHAHRGFVMRHWLMLRSMARTLQALQRKAQEIGRELHLPIMLGAGEHIVSFRSIFPLHLLREEGITVVPFDGIESLNGNLMGITGRYGGGKTSLELAMPLDIYMAQSGLPLFSEQFCWNVKRVIGVLVNRPTKGSTCVSLLAKIAEILKAIKDTPGNEVVLTLDEIGLGAQEGDGYQLGHDLLCKLKQRGVSVLFSTQISSLAEYARDELGATCYQVTADHQILPGIGSGDMASLREAMGLDELLTLEQ